MGFKKYRHALAQAGKSAIGKHKEKLGGLGHLMVTIGAGAFSALASKDMENGFFNVRALRPDTVITGLALIGMGWKKHRKLAKSIALGSGLAVIFGWIYRSQFKLVSGEDGRIYLEGAPPIARAATPPPKRSKRAEPIDAQAD